MQLRSHDGASLVLTPVDYQFPDRAQGDPNANWLLIQGQVSTPRGNWDFTDPCLTTFEALDLGKWLHRAAAGDVPPSSADNNGNSWPDTRFLEPNVGFAVADRSPGDVLLRVHFSLESAPPWAQDERHSCTHQVFIEFDVAEDQLHAAAEQWLMELQPFPSRDHSEDDG